VGFSAPVALAAMAFTKYLAPFGLQNNNWLPIAIIILVGLMHSFTIKHSSRFHNSSTLVKVLFLVVLIVLGFILPGSPVNAVNTTAPLMPDLFNTQFAVGMVYVSFAYAGWNAAAYVADEIENPKKNMPAALIGSALFVALMYVLFQFVLLKNGSRAQLQGKEEVTFIAFGNLLGSTGGKWVSAFIAIQLIATISSYLWVGPRVTWAMAREYKLWQPMARVNSHGIPVAAIWLHVGISVALALSGRFEQVLLYSGFVLQLMATLTVATSLVLKKPAQGVFKSPFKPWLQIIFLAFNTAVLVFTFAGRPFESLVGMGILGAGLILYLFDKPVPANTQITG
jgi:APA family basic amino acid/polyamine antiporter